MSDHATNMDRLFDLAGMVCDDIASSEEFIELDSIVQADEAAREWYLCYCRTHISLKLELRAKLATESVYQQIGIDPSAAGSSELQISGKDARLAMHAPTFPATFLNTPFTYLSSGWPVAYLIATVIFSIGALIGTFITVSHPMHVALESSPTDYDVEKPQRESNIVGQITGMVDSKWAGTEQVAREVALGSTYDLASGLVAITYNTGAKVILQGPVTYEVASRNGGYLSVGKLTAAVTDKNAQGFCVRTPNATVTDIGTEFGVEVEPSGESAVTVFRGLVSVASGRSDTPAQKQDIRAGESVRVRTSTSGGASEIIQVAGNASPRFVRVLPRNRLPEYRTVVLADKPLFYWTFNESTGSAFEQVRHLAHQRLDPLESATRCSHAAIGSGLALGRAADFSHAAGCFLSRPLNHGELGGAWAIEFWAQFTGNLTGHTSQYLLNGGMNNRPGVIFDWNHGHGDNLLGMYSIPGGSTAGTPQINDSRWRHVMLVVFGAMESGVASRVDIILDGQRMTIDPAKFDARFDLRRPMVVGAGRSEGQQPLVGRLDELALYDLSDRTTAETELRMLDMARRHIDAARSQYEGISEKGNER